jgi:hypothetical protein
VQRRLELAGGGDLHDPDRRADLAAGSALAEFPMPASWKPFELGLHESRFSYNSTFSRRPIVNRYSGFWPPSYITLIHEVEDFPSEHAMRALVVSGVGYVLLHERFYSRDRYLAVTHALGTRTDVSSFGPCQEGPFEVRAFRLLSRQDRSSPGGIPLTRAMNGH